jgi:hypothetical protein
MTKANSYQKMQRLADWLGASERGETTMTKRNRERPATTAEIAAVEFDGAVSRMTAGQRATAIADLLETISPLLPLAYEIGLASKDELVARVEREYEELGPRLMQLLRAREAAEIMHDMLDAAEARLAVALAVVEGPEDGEDGEGATQH